MTQAYEREVRARLEPGVGELVHAVTLRGHIGPLGRTWLRLVLTHCGIKGDRVPVLVRQDEPLTCGGCLEADGRDAVDMAWALMVDARMKQPATA